ncbi:peptidase C14 [Scytonema hofmannii PCC 7110]|uniref:Peptidase C14 n=1 Tax=Scytonema hofmannii PCC 7110 TaxID=128403 RepID=A0A139WSK2_9CYAN|nr:caspase domain-containing protein [Scytonema hofmannii]KYC35410.1 peptidase C14 [Scytonema hofmannii PCC 7110]
MCPLGVGTSSSAHTLTTGEAKLWVFLVGVNHYQDESLPSLRYPAIDCQGLAEALAKATRGFPKKEVIIHHDFGTHPPTLETVRRSLQQLISQTRYQDTVLLYFSGHGMLEQSTQQAVLCLSDTNKDNLLTSGLSLQALLQILSASPAHQQLLCLDTCHSGDMVLVGSGAKGAIATDENSITKTLDITPQLQEVLRKRASQSKGFCALLSCDQGQQSWEFPELGHGLFTYYLMRGLLGEAADSQGVIDADGLYKYVYSQTLRYIDKKNQQLRLINQQKLSRGDTYLHPEYPLQTPKRIVEGVGELIVGLKPGASTEVGSVRRALVVDGFSNHKISRALSQVMRESGGFELEYWPQKGKAWSEVREAIQSCLRCQSPKSLNSPGGFPTIKQTATALLYLRGQIEEIEDGEAWLVLGDGVRISRSWLRQELRRCAKTQQIVVLDCPGATSLAKWVEALQLGSEQGQCAIAVATPKEQPELFSQMVLETLTAADTQVGLPVAGWIAQLQILLELKGIPLHLWLSSAPGILDMLPGNLARIPSQEVEINEETPEFPTAQPLNSFNVLGRDEAYSYLYLGLEQQTQLEHLLKEEIGPIASTLLKKVLAKVTNSEELIEKLAQHLLPQQRIKFEQQAKLILQAISVQPQPQPRSLCLPSQKNQVLDEEFLRQCEQQLANSVGPIAHFLIKKALKAQPLISPMELVNVLIAYIPNPQQAMEFQQRLLD